MWEWSTPRAYLHDAISTDKRNPQVNANGLIYGSPEESTDMVPVQNPLTNEATQIKHPFRDAKTPSSLDLLRGRSPYWGDGAIWDGPFRGIDFDKQRSIRHGNDGVLSRESERGKTPRSAVARGRALEREAEVSADGPRRDKVRPTESRQKIVERDLIGQILDPN